jgi:hypothetical protein
LSIKQALIRLPKTRSKEMMYIENNLKNILEQEDESLKMAILADLLQEELENE